eukprot:7258958-Pyramimonas_sp.AAC.1
MCIRDSLGAPRSLLGASSGGRLGFSARVPSLELLLGPSWGPLGPSWVPLGLFWGALRPSWVPLGRLVG